jgi:hypothetical protein
MSRYGMPAQEGEALEDDAEGFSPQGAGSRATQ